MTDPELQRSAAADRAELRRLGLQPGHDLGRLVGAVLGTVLAVGLPLLLAWGWRAVMGGQP